MKTGKIILGILIGTSAGALMGMLFAPQNGADARKRIAKMGKKYADTIKEKFDETLDDITEKFNKVKDDVAGYTYWATDKAEKSKKGNSVEIH
jgi:gas vesicle protein